MKVWGSSSWSCDGVEPTISLSPVSTYHEPSQSDDRYRLNIPDYRSEQFRFTSAIWIIMVINDNEWTKTFTAYSTYFTLVNITDKHGLISKICYINISPFGMNILNLLDCNRIASMACTSRNGHVSLSRSAFARSDLYHLPEGIVFIARSQLCHLPTGMKQSVVCPKGFLPHGPKEFVSLAK